MFGNICGKLNRRPRIFSEYIKRCKINNILIYSIIPASYLTEKETRFWELIRRALKLSQLTNKYYPF